MWAYWGPVFGKLLALSILSLTGLFFGGLLYVVLLDGPGMPWWLGWVWMFCCALVTLATGWNLMLDKKGHFRR